MITFNEKTQSVTLCGQEFSLEFFQRVQAPLLVECLHWSPETLVNWCESAEIPLGQFARVPKVQTFLIEREEERQKAAKEQAEREYWAHYNSPEQVAQRARDTEALHQSRLRASQAARGRSNGRATTLIAELID
ncbi:hypothetical protein ACET9K_06160 [Aeromonas enteropelogenes]|uniref:hypothetical protein n=1 Tax=Aeromonas enteropelogenes TaxID=29489 RepID=UPI0038D1DEA1